jgi:hypothetical protein
MKFLSKKLISNEAPILIFGSGLLKRGLNLKLIQNFFLNINPSSIFYYIPLFANSMGIGLNGIKNITLKDINNHKNGQIIFLNCNDTIFLRKISSKNTACNYLWVNTHFSSFFSKERVFSSFEQSYDLDKGVFVNLEIRAQGIFDEKNINAITYNNSYSESINIRENIDQYLLEISNNSEKYSKVIEKYYVKLFFNKLNNNKNIISSYPTKPVALDYYCLDTLTRFSKNLIQARKFLKNNFF